MKLVCQQEALDNIRRLAEHDQHGVLIFGSQGCGKTYVARQYAKLLGISDFCIINPVMSDLKSMISECVSSGSPVVLCIENLDSGVVQAAYPLLKLIEDCPRHIYIVVTCTNFYSIPDTIPSRCAQVTVNSPTPLDIEKYAKFRDESAYENIVKEAAWSGVRSLKDVDTVMGMTSEQLGYYRNLSRLSFKDSVSTIAWTLQHYEDKSPTPVDFVVRYLMSTFDGARRGVCISCLNNLSENNLSVNAVVSKLAFELKYTE